MSFLVQSLEKSTNIQTPHEPENMTTIDLNKCDNTSNDNTNKFKDETNNKFKIYYILKTVLLVVGLFILLGLCLSILVLLIQRGYYKYYVNKTSHLEEPTFQILLNHKDKINACKISKSYEDCCNVLSTTNLIKDIEKCTVHKVLKLFFKYELEANKRFKRQYYDPNFSYDPASYPDYPENVYEYYQPGDNNDYVPYVGYPNSDNIASFEHNYYQDSYTSHNDQTYIRENQQENDDHLQQSFIREFQPENQLEQNLPQEIVGGKAFKTIVSIKEATPKFENNFKISESNSRSRANQKTEKQATEDKLRISQGTDFEIKPQNEVQSSQSRQVNPCVVPVSTSLVQTYPSSPLYGPMSLNTNFQQQPLYVINPPLYTSIPMQYQYPQAQLFNKNSIQVAGAGGQYYICNPVSASLNNKGLQGVEVRQNLEASSLQELINYSPVLLRNNQTREAIDCPFGTRACDDNSKCIHERQLCDNEVNCNDASDEIECSCRNRVGELRWCDGYLDCPNGEDEQNCFECGEDEISCDDWSRFQHGTCVSISQKCDGVIQCEITGNDEEDCSILTDHLGSHPLNTISNAAGFLHRNYKGKWYPTCFGADTFSIEVCKTEAGPTEMIPSSNLVTSNDNYIGPFLDFSPHGGISIVNSCMRNKATYVECPPLYCGLRLTISNPFRATEVDTSAEDFLSKMQSRTKNRFIVGEPRVVGGKPSQPTAWPWVVSIYKNGVFHCGGVLISEIWVITAAHCVDRFWFYYYEVQAGVLRRFSYSPMEQSRWATIAIPHEDYNKKSLKNDIALMKLSKPVRFNRYVRPICLPSAEIAGEEFLRGPKPNTVCVTVGWGATVEHGTDPDHLREVEIPILAQCKHAEDREGDEICAGLLEGGRDACQGDSGGPLMCQSVKIQNQWYLAGVVSHGEGCARPNEPGVYTKVSKYLGWINANIHGKTTGRSPLQKCPGYICTGTRKCIPKKRHCDKIVDCLYGDDELDCYSSGDIASRSGDSIVGSKLNLFERFLKLLKLSDAQSRDSEEVNNHPQNKFSADSDNSSGLIKPTHTKHLDINNATTKFRCKNMLQIIPQQEKCDKVVNCEDGTDEVECSCVDFLRRFHVEAICNGITDCKDMSDEANCAKCSQDHYFCRISQKCVPLEKRCDGTADCIKAEDEWDCVALTDGRALALDSDLRPKQSMEGIITINRFGVWRPLCTNASVEEGASIAANACNLLGFQEYTLFHRLRVTDKSLNITFDGFEINHHHPLEGTSLCGGLFIRCSNISFIDNAGKLHQNNFTFVGQFVSFPWNALIFFNGNFKCTGTIFNQRWIITARSCFPASLQVNSYVSALVGKGMAYLDIEGPHEQIVQIDMVTNVEDSNAILLHTQQKIYFNRYVQPAQINTNSKLKNEQCIAIGIQNKRTKITVLQPGANCSEGFRCFRQVTDNCQNGTWNGVITCSSRDGWYTAAVYDKLTTSCNFSHHEFNRINSTSVRYSMGDNLIKLEIPDCKGFRCSLGDCISKTKVCDGLSDCRNSEDEEPDFCANLQEECHLWNNCRNFSACTWLELKCPNGKCVPKSSFCDTINNCGDNYDEPEECSCRTYLERVHPEKICDGTVNCWDRSDETQCNCQFPTNITCSGSTFCISQEMLCDGFQDCSNGEDESRCYSLKTNLENINSGEVLKCTAGVWHSGCFARNLTTTQLEEICEKLGFSGMSGRLLMPPKNTEYVAMKPTKDHFDVVWIHRGRGSELRLRLRTGNAPYLNFVQDSNCFKLFIQCM